jgi:hypothetical protein
MDYPSMDKMDAFCSAYLGPYRDQPLDILDVGSASIDGAETYRQILAHEP